ncbi:MAG: hypothetical protein PHD88_10265 [Firmicutes bacterium]|nr:hypothetical protein [Bacillota bacterium]MDD4694746.1 hypothetical protein [Bacillota bacterium]
MQNLRDQKKLYKSIKECKFLSVNPDPLLLNHIRREADKFLDELSYITSLM